MTYQVVARTWRPQSSILVAMALIPFSSVAMATSAFIEGPVLLFGLELHPITLMMVIVKGSIVRPVLQIVEIAKNISQGQLYARVSDKETGSFCRGSQA